MPASAENSYISVLFFNLCIYVYFAASHGLWDPSSLPEQGWNLHPLQWKHGLLITGTTREAPLLCFKGNAGCILPRSSPCPGSLPLGPSVPAWLPTWNASCCLLSWTPVLEPRLHPSQKLSLPWLPASRPQHPRLAPHTECSVLSSELDSCAGAALAPFVPWTLVLGEAQCSLSAHSM